MNIAAFYTTVSGSEALGEWRPDAVNSSERVLNGFSRMKWLVAEFESKSNKG